MSAYLLQCSASTQPQKLWPSEHGWRIDYYIANPATSAPQGLTIPSHAQQAPVRHQIVWDELQHSPSTEQ